MSLWRSGDFLRLWSAQTISQLGTQVTFPALPLAATIGLRETLWVGAIGATLAFLPLLFSPIRSVR